MDPATGLTPTPITLESVKGQFAHWRATRTGISRIPDELWDTVGVLTKRHTYSQISCALGLNANQLRSRFGNAVTEASSVSAPPDFIEVALSSPPSFSPSAPFAQEPTSPQIGIIEFSRPDGATLKASGLASKDLLFLAQRFLGQ